MSDSGEKIGEEVNPCSVQQSSMHLEQGQEMDNENSETLESRVCVERQLESLHREREGLVKEVNGLQARVSEMKQKLEVEDGTLPHPQEWDAHSRIERLEERANAEEERLKQLLEENIDSADDAQLSSSTEDMSIDIEPPKSENSLISLIKQKKNEVFQGAGRRNNTQIKFATEKSHASSPSASPANRKSSLKTSSERQNNSPVRFKRFVNDPPQVPSPLVSPGRRRSSIKISSERQNNSPVRFENDSSDSHPFTSSGIRYPRRRSSLKIHPEGQNNCPVRFEDDSAKALPPLATTGNHRGRRRSSLKIISERVSNSPLSCQNDSAQAPPSSAAPVRARRRSSITINPAPLGTSLFRCEDTLASPKMHAASISAPQHCRLGIEVIGIQVRAGHRLPSSFIKLVHGSLKEKTETASGEGHVGFDYKCSLEMKERHLGVELRMRKAGHLHNKALGVATVDVDALQTIYSSDEFCAPAPLRVVMYDSKGQVYEPVEFLLLRIVKVMPPGPSETIKVLVGTWNLGDAPPPSVDILQHWLQPDKVQEASLVVVGTQECQYKRGTVDGVEYESAEHDWVETLSTVIGDTHTLYQGMSLGKTRICIWVRLDILAGIHHFQAGDKGTGYPVPYSSKGGVAVLLSVWDTTIVFVNCHLAAHMGTAFLARRNQDYSDIAGGISLGDPDCGLLNQFHHCIWLGDVNYRLDLSKTFGDEATEMKASQECHEHVLTMIREGKYQQLLETDQLIQARRQGQAFTGFEEAAIEHPPTFKVQRNQPLAYKAKRIPAYTDRIQWRSLLPSLRTRCVDQWIAESVSTSDHKPVAALLQVDMRPPRPEWWPRVGGGAHNGDERHHPSVHGHFQNPLAIHRVNSACQSLGSRVTSACSRTESHADTAPPPPEAPQSPAPRLAQASFKELGLMSLRGSLPRKQEEVTAKPPPFFSALRGTPEEDAADGDKKLRNFFSKTLGNLSNLTGFGRAPSSSSHAQAHMPGHKPELENWTVQVKSLRGADLASPYKGSGKVADPYVTFYSEVLVNSVHSEAARNTDHPTWASNDLALSLAAPSFAELQWEYIVVSVKHKGRVGSPDVTLGVGVILVDELSQSLGSDVHLIIPLLSAGLQKGCVLCTLKMEAAGAAKVPSFRKQRFKVLKHASAQQRASCWPSCWPWWVSKGTRLSSQQQSAARTAIRGSARSCPLSSSTTIPSEAGQLNARHPMASAASDSLPPSRTASGRFARSRSCESGALRASAAPLEPPSPVSTQQAPSCQRPSDWLPAQETRAFSNRGPSAAPENDPSVRSDEGSASSVAMGTPDAEPEPADPQPAASERAEGAAGALSGSGTASALPRKLTPRLTEPPPTSHVTASDPSHVTASDPSHVTVSDRGESESALGMQVEGAEGAAPVVAV